MSGNSSHNDKGAPLLENWLGVDNVSQKLWTIAYTLIGLGIVIALMGFYGVVTWDGSRIIALGYVSLGGLSGYLGTYMAKNGLTDIPAHPVHVGILTIWGKRIEVLLREGTYLLADYWPFRVGVVLVEAELESHTFDLNDVLCINAVDADGHPTQDAKKAAGGMVNVQVSVTMGPDYKAKTRGKHPKPCGAKRVIDWLNRGGRDGVTKILGDMVDESVRHLAGEFDWETFLFMKAPLTVAVLAKVADIDFKSIPRNPDGSFKDIPEDITPEMYHKYRGVVHNPLKYLLEKQTAAGVSVADDERDRRLVEIDVFLKVARLNGVSDIVDLGAHIARINVNEIVPNDALKEASQGAAIEKQERKKETWDTQTGIELAQQFIDFAKKNKGKIDPQEALRLSRIDRRRSTETTVLTPSAADPMSKAAGIIAGGNQSRGSAS